MTDVIHDANLSSYVNGERVQLWLASGDRNYPDEPADLKSRIVDGALKWTPDKLARFTGCLVGKDQAAGARLQDEFGQLVYQAREHSGAGVKLSCGVVVKRGDKHYVCVLPRCDGERVPAAGQGFPFLEVVAGRGKKSQNLSLKLEGANGKPALCHVTPKMQELLVFRFDPTEPGSLSGQSIAAVRLSSSRPRKRRRRSPMSDGSGRSWHRASWRHLGLPACESA